MYFHTDLQYQKLFEYLVLQCFLENLDMYYRSNTLHHYEIVDGFLY